MNHIGFLIAAYLLFWVFLGGYAITLGTRSKDLQQRLDTLAKKLDS